MCEWDINFAVFQFDRACSFGGQRKFDQVPSCVSFLLHWKLLYQTLVARAGFSFSARPLPNLSVNTNLSNLPKTRSISIYVVMLNYNHGMIQVSYETTRFLSSEATITHLLCLQKGKIACFRSLWF